MHAGLSSCCNIMTCMNRAAQELVLPSLQALSSMKHCSRQHALSGTLSRSVMCSS